MHHEFHYLLINEINYTSTNTDSSEHQLVDIHSNIDFMDIELVNNIDSPTPLIDDIPNISSESGNTVSMTDLQLSNFPNHTVFHETSSNSLISEISIEPEY